jgi:hypothetical protein
VKPARAPPLSAEALGSAREVCLWPKRTDLPERSARASPGGSLLEFPQPRSQDRGALVTSSFPSRSSLGGCLAPPVKCALPESILGGTSEIGRGSWAVWSSSCSRNKEGDGA